jgi:hypothetical protein
MIYIFSLNKKKLFWTMGIPEKIKKYLYILFIARRK